MEATEFGRYVALARECAYHNDCGLGSVGDILIKGKKQMMESGVSQRG